MKKRILSILLTVCMVLCLAPTAVFAEGTPAGTADDPILISSAQELKNFAERVNNGETTLCAKLTADIVLNDGTFDADGHWSESGTPNQWTPINGYAGTFDGNGHTVKGLYVKDVQYAGLFGYAEGATVKNMAVGGYISTSVDKSCSGGIAGYLSGGSVTGCLNSCTVNAKEYAGGIVGVIAQYGKVTDCGNTGTISGSFVAGGIVGYTRKTDIPVQNCYNIGAVSSSKEYAGGIVGLHGLGVIKNCYWLTGTAKRTAGYIADADLNTHGEKSKAEFANGTVLNLLQNGDENSPWEKCGYLSAAGMIVPMLNWQTGDTFPIYTAEDLKTFRDAVNAGNTDINAKLMNDIVLNDGAFDADGNWSESGTPDQWTPIVGNYGYGGTFDGDGHTIRGLYVKGGEYAGLFGNVWGGTVKNVTVTGYVEGTRFVGGIVGYGNNASITGCTNAAVVKAKCDGSFVDVGGIVGCFFANGNVGNCANLGSVWAQIDSNQEIAKVGGIAGCLGDQNVTIADCYNAGSIAIEDSGTGEYDYVSYLGGIVGSTLMTLEPSYISNCYSVGSLTYRGSASAEICGIIGYNVDLFITNCYWLEGTAESGIGGSPRQVTNTSAHTKADFANGTVLELLKGDRTDSPWADECKYLAAAGMTLPVFKGQGDSHTHSEKTGNCLDGIYCECGYLMHGAESEHNWGEWQHLTTSHTRGCDKPGCGVTQSGNCSGGTATCTEQATCDVCHEKYGNTNPDNHTDTTEWIRTETKHTQKYKCCGAVTVTEEDHEWENGVCTECHYTCAHSGGNATCTEQAVCEICGEKYGAVDPDNHTDITEWVQTETKHTQKYKCCGAVTVAEEDHEWKNGVCAECGYDCRHDYEWQSENGQYWQKCKFCNHETAKKDIPTINISGADKVCRTQDYKFSFSLPEGAADAAYGYEFIGLGDGPLTPTVENNLYSGILKASIYPAEENGFKLIVSAKTADGFEFSVEKTVTIQNEHTGGTATCKDKAVCEICGESYGELDSNNHADLKHIDAKAATKTAEGNIEYWYCEGCGKYFADKDGAKEITKADTVTAKLPDDSKSPQTGDNSNLTLWIALLFISGGAVTATTVYGRKKKRLTK